MNLYRIVSSLGLQNVARGCACRPCISVNVCAELDGTRYEYILQFSSQNAVMFLFAHLICMTVTFEAHTIRQQDSVIY